jgi:hypothetical protein
MTTLPAACHRDRSTRFQPAVNANVPSAFHWLPAICWFAVARPSSVPDAFWTMNVAATERFEPATHHASTVRVAAASR